jgi:hypothetical protein
MNKDLTVLLALVAQSIAAIQLPEVTHKVYLDVEVDGQHIGISWFVQHYYGF